jgi:hypothetical protein
VQPAVVEMATHVSRSQIFWKGLKQRWLLTQRLADGGATFEAEFTNWTGKETPVSTSIAGSGATTAAAKRTFQSNA